MSSNKKSSWWYRWLPDRLFFLPAGFWGILAGVLLAIAINLLTAIRFELDARLVRVHFIIVAIILFITAAFGFAWLSLVIEGCYRDVTNPLDVKPAIRGAKPKLAALLLGSILLMALAFVLFFACP